MPANNKRGPLTYTLKQDIELVTQPPGGEETTEVLHAAGTVIPLRRPKAKDMRVIDDHQEAPIASIIALIGKISKLDPLAIENLDAEDLTALGNALAAFMPDGPKTGATP